MDKMEIKCVKKSTMQQLKALVKYMEENPDLARGAPVFGSNKFSVDEKWKDITKILNAMGPPTRSLSEWKKTWADMKLRTKKKIAENSKSLKETGGGLYQYNDLSVLEQIIDRTLLLSSAAAPSGRVFGGTLTNSLPESIEECFASLVKSPARNEKAVAVVTPNRQSSEKEGCHSQAVNVTKLHQTQQKRRHSQNSNSSDDQPACSSAKKVKSNVEQQLLLIRRQLRVAEKNAATESKQMP